jgi:hypothetical protein
MLSLIFIAMNILRDHSTRFLLYSMYALGGWSSSKFRKAQISTFADFQNFVLDLRTFCKKVYNSLSNLVIFKTLHVIVQYVELIIQTPFLYVFLPY